MNHSEGKVTKELSVLAHNLKFLRKLNRLSQEDLANQLEIKRSNIAAYESKNIEPRLRIILKIGNFFDINLGDLLKSRLTEENYSSFSVDDTEIQNSSFNGRIELNDISVLEGFIDQSVKMRKVLDGFKALYAFKKSMKKKEEKETSKLVYDIDNFMDLTEHLLSYNEAVIKAIQNTVNVEE